MSNFFQRTISGAVFVIILIGSVLFNQYTCLALFSIIAIGSQLEFYKLVKNYNVSPSVLFGLLAGGTLLLVNILFQLQLVELKMYFIILPLTFLIFIAELYRKTSQPFINIAASLVGVVYAVIPFLLLIDVAYFSKLDHQYHAHLILGILLLQWASDTGQYLFGMWLGNRKLFERISPKKSWEGFIGGFFFCVAIGFLISKFFDELLPHQWMIVSALIVVFGTLGDLVESMLKRSINIKDSGNIMPGHGGFLDRFDGVLGAMPFVYFYIKLFC